MKTAPIHQTAGKNRLPKLFPHLFVVVLMAIAPCSVLTAQDYAYITITSSDKKAVVAGERYDGNIYLQELKDRDNGKWQFIPAGDGFYYIVDIRHDKALVAGDNYDNNVYHQDHGNRDNAKWRLVSKGQNRFQLFDKKHGKALVGGDVYDGRVYHQVPGLRQNAIWTLTIVDGAGTRTAPREMYLFETFVDIRYDINSTIPDNNEEPKTSTLSSKFTNNTTQTQTHEISEQTTFTDSDSWESMREISMKTWLKIEASVGWKAGGTGGIEATLLTSTGFEKTETDRNTTAHSAQYSTSVGFKSNMLIPAGKTVACSQLVTRNKASIPFVITVRRTYGDLSTRTENINGTWKGVIISRSEITCTESGGTGGSKPAVPAKKVR